MAPTNKSDKTRFPRKRFEQVCKAVVRSTTVKMMLFPTVANTNAIPFMMLVITVEMYKGLWLAWSKITSRKKQLKFSEGCVRFDVPINEMKLLDSNQNVILVSLLPLIGL